MSLLLKVGQYDLIKEKMDSLEVRWHILHTLLQGYTIHVVTQNKYYVGQIDLYS